MPEFGKIKDVKVGDTVCIARGHGEWGSGQYINPLTGLVSEVFRITEIRKDCVLSKGLHPPHIFFDEKAWPFYLERNIVVSTEKPLLTLPFNYSLNRTYWNDKLQAEMIQKATAQAESQIRRSLREWPWGKILKPTLELEKDLIHFSWAVDTANNRSF